MSLLNIEELMKEPPGPFGFRLSFRPIVECDWRQIRETPARSINYLRLAQEGETEKIGQGNDFVETGLLYISEADKEKKDIVFDYDYLPVAQGRKKALLLDRDGILIDDTGYPGKIRDIHFKEEVIPFLQLMRKQSYELVVLTNQSGIARKKYSLKDFHQTNKYIEEHYAALGLPILKTYFCPFHKDALLSEYRRESGFRKPYPGMALLAAQELGLDLSKSFMIGDRPSDKLNLSYLRSYTVNGQDDASNFKSFESLIEYFEKI